MTATTHQGSGAGEVGGFDAKTLRGRLEQETADRAARLSEETLGQVRLVHDTARRWKHPVA